MFGFSFQPEHLQYKQTILISLGTLQNTNLKCYLYDFVNDLSMQQQQLGPCALLDLRVIRASFTRNNKTSLIHQHQKN